MLFTAMLRVMNLQKTAGLREAMGRQDELKTQMAAAHKLGDVARVRSSSIRSLHHRAAAHPAHLWYGNEATDRKLPFDMDE